MMSHFEIECLDCGRRSAGSPLTLTCPHCDSEWVEARYDLEASASNLATNAGRRPFNLWRYREVLPLNTFNPLLVMGDGGTPLVTASNLGMMLGLNHLYIKDERQGPTASFKDRQAAVTIAALKEAGVTEAVVASTGNVAIAYSAYGARAGIKIWAFLTSLVPAAKMHEVALYGTQVVKVTSTYDQAKHLAAEFARKRGLYLDRSARSMLNVEAMKTMAYEVAEQLGAIYSGSEDEAAPPTWHSPDWYVQSVSGGIGPIGVSKGFVELKAMGLTQGVPSLGIIQTAGCAPMVHAWRAGASVAEPVTTPTTHISTLSTGDPGRAYGLLRERVSTYGGTMESVTDEEAIQAMHLLAKMEGISVEPAAGVAIAGLIKLVHLGVIGADEIVVVNCSGHTMPIEEELLQEGWAQAIDWPEGELPASPQEGLLAALARLDQRRTRSVLIVDDHPDARRLIRRILQAQGSYTVREVGSGPEALSEARAHPPDLVILDLMMPEMDGFEVLDRLKDEQATQQVPVIVVTAKDLTLDEKKRLEGQISRLMTKGDFLNEDLLEEISKALR
jgi:threonine synthase